MESSLSCIPLDDENVDKNLVMMVNPETGILEKYYENSNCVPWDVEHSDNIGMILNHETGIFEKLTMEDDSENDTLLLKSLNSIPKKQINKKLRLYGAKYTGVQIKDGKLMDKNKPRRKLRKTPCNHGCMKKSDRSFLCGAVDSQSRKTVFKYFWDLDLWEAKRAYINGLVLLRSPIRRRILEEQIQMRQNGIDCYLPMCDGQKVRVCREFFIGTFDITKDMFIQWICPKNVMIENEDRIVRKNKREKNKNPLKAESVLKWLELLPKVPSHYCRSNNSRIYVEETFQSITNMHKVYTLWCNENLISAVQRKKFSQVLKSQKVSIFRPRKDQCDVCVTYKEGNLEEAEYHLHLLKKNEAREAKNFAISTCSDEHLVFTMDAQSTQLCPKLLVSSQYYKQKLQLHNFTIFKNNTKDGYLYVWHEGIGGVTCNEFVSCIMDFLKEQIDKEHYKKVTMISDGCLYENKNKTLASALADFSKLHKIEIQQLILEKGHTMMEVDSVHSTIEKLTKPPLYAPVDYLNCMRRARTSQPYFIKYLDFSFFKNYEANPNNFSSIRPGKKAGDATVTEIRAMLYKNGEVFYKLRHPSSSSLGKVRLRSRFSAAATS